MFVPRLRLGEPPGARTQWVRCGAQDEPLCSLRGARYGARRYPIVQAAADRHFGGNDALLVERSPLVGPDFPPMNPCCQPHAPQTCPSWRRQPRRQGCPLCAIPTAHTRPSPPPIKGRAAGVRLTAGAAAVAAVGVPPSWPLRRPRRWGAHSRGGGGPCGDGEGVGKETACPGTGGLMRTWTTGGSGDQGGSLGGGDGTWGGWGGGGKMPRGCAATNVTRGRKGGGRRGEEGR